MASSFPTCETAEQALTLIREMRYPQAPNAPNFEPAGVRGGSGSLASRYWGLSSPQYRDLAGIWRLDPGGNLVPFFTIENRHGVANLRRIARELKEKNVGVVFWAGTSDLSVSYANDKDAVATAVDAILATGREVGLPIAVNGFANVTE